MKIGGIDTFRFIAALWVLFGHQGFFPIGYGLDPSDPVAHAVQGILNNLISGPAAVIVFFIISGFCIHLPFKNEMKLNVGKFFVRRYLRLGLPIIALVIMNYALLGKDSAESYARLYDGIFWSLYAELIYYTIYPLLFRLRRRVSFEKMIIYSFVLALGLAATNPTAGNYPSFGIWGNWILGLPCWLLGCLLAERMKFDEATVTPSQGEIWIWRFSIWGISWITSAMRFHTHVGFPWTLNFFALAAFFWLRREIAYFRTVPANRLLEFGGLWAYSIYLCHTVFPSFLAKFHFPNLGPNLNWTLATSLNLCLCLVFYFVVERPSHLVARKVGR